VTDGYFGVRFPSYGAPGTYIDKETIFGGRPKLAYKWLSVNFNPAPYSGAPFTIYVGFWGPGDNGWVQIDNLTLRKIEPYFNLVDDNLFLNQAKGVPIAAPWRGEGDGDGIKGVNWSFSESLNDEKATAFLRASSGWNAISQRIATANNVRYVATASIRTTQNVEYGFFGVRDGYGRKTEIRFGPAPDESEIRLPFTGSTGGYDPMMTLYLGYWGPGADSCVEIQSVGVFPETILTGGVDPRDLVAASPTIPIPPLDQELLNETRGRE
jgi:hypothetical protein